MFRFLAALVMFGHCALANAQWQQDTFTDKMRGAENKTAALQSNNFVQLAFPYAGGSSLSIWLRDFPKQFGKDAMLVLSKGQIVCPIRDCTIEMKFDDGPIVRFAAQQAQSRSDTVFISDYHRFVQMLLKSRALTIEIYAWKNGLSQFEFDTAGLVWK